MSNNSNQKSTDAYPKNYTTPIIKPKNIREFLAQSIIVRNHAKDERLKYLENIFKSNFCAVCKCVYDKEFRSCACGYVYCYNDRIAKLEDILREYTCYVCLRGDADVCLWECACDMRFCSDHRKCQGYINNDRYMQCISCCPEYKMECCVCHDLYLGSNTHMCKLPL